MGLGTEVLLEVVEGAAIITLNRPEKLNAVDDAMLNGLEEAFDLVEEDLSVSSAIVVGAGTRAFTVGIDINAVQGGPRSARAFVARELIKFYDRAVRSRVPVIAAIEGYAYATGAEFPMCCDMAYAGEGVKFCFPDLNLGLAVATASWRTSFKMNRMRFAELAYTSSSFTAREAYEIGLLTRVVPDGTALETALKTARIIAAKAPVGLRITKRAMNRFYGDDWMAFLELQQQTIYSDDFAEAVLAFQERREPQFRGR